MNRIVIVANDTVESPLLFDAMLMGTDAVVETDVSVVAPALNRRLRHRASDVDGTRAAAERLREPFDVPLLQIVVDEGGERLLDETHSIAMSA